MSRKLRVALILGLVVGAAAVGGVMVTGSGGDAKVKVAVAHGTVQDPAADAAIDDGQPGAVSPRADITSVSVERRREGIAFTVAVREPVDPLTDPNWAAGGSHISWEIDTTGDGEDDFELTYNVQDGRLDASSRGVMANGEEMHCPHSKAFFDPAVGYTAVIRTPCLGPVKSFTYRAMTSYQTDATNDDAPAATDVAPNEGMAAE